MIEIMLLVFLTGFCLGFGYRFCYWKFSRVNFVINNNDKSDVAMNWFSYL